MPLRSFRSWHVRVVLATAALVLAGCAQAGSTQLRPTVSPTVSPTASPTVAVRPLTWQSATSPVSPPSSPTYAPAPSDGRVTYACGYGGSNGAPGVRVWSTSTGGASWTGGASLPFAGHVTGCALTIDENDPKRLFVALDTVNPAASPGASAFVALISLDGGTTWQALPHAGPHTVSSLASYAGAIYAAGDGLSASGAEVVDVWVSHDGGRSWNALGTSSLVPHAPNALIWLNAQTGELLGLDSNGSTLWRSENGGASWTSIPVPDEAGMAGQQSLAVAQNGVAWRICASGQTAPGQQQRNTLACSADLGKTWTQPPTLNPAQRSPKGFTFIASTYVFAITVSGALLASYEDVAAGTELAMLAPGASAWVSLGAVNTGVGVTSSGYPVFYASGPGDGALWASPNVATVPFLTAEVP